MQQLGGRPLGTAAAFFSSDRFTGNTRHGYSPPVTPIQERHAGHKPAEAPTRATAAQPVTPYRCTAGLNQSERHAAPDLPEQPAVPTINLNLPRHPAGITPPELHSRLTPRAETAPHKVTRQRPSENRSGATPSVNNFAAKADPPVIGRTPK